VIALLPTFITVTDKDLLVVPNGVDGNLSACGDQLTAVPVPVKLAGCGLPGSESGTSRFAVRGPGAVGVNCTEAVHKAPGAKLLPQLLLARKSPGFVPATLTPPMLKVVVPVFCIVTGTAADAVAKVRVPNDRVRGDNDTAVPIAVILTVCGLLGSESEIVRVPV